MFRVFVSSTFSDLKEERNALQREVWPKLRDLCQRHGARFQAIDLRWGVSQEAGRDQRTIDICLGEIVRCQEATPRPNFVVLLGDRYGWRPLPAHVPADEFEAILASVSPQERELLLWHESQPEDRKGWYRRDDNATPYESPDAAEYVLLPRTTDAHDRDWPVIERDLRRVFQAGIREGRVAIRDRSIYEDSATHQEIARGVLAVPDAAEHVVCAFREIKGLPADASAGEFGDADEESRQRQVELKEALRAHVGEGGIVRLCADWTPRRRPTLDHLDRLCNEVFRRLSASIARELSRMGRDDPVAAEASAHEEFRARRVEGFQGRSGALAAIDDYIAGGHPHAFVLHGASGSGKTAVMAKAVEQARAAGRTVIARFLGATPGSTNVRELLDGVCRALARATGTPPPDDGLDYPRTIGEYCKRIGEVPSDRPVVLFLDALDQIDAADPGAECCWLARALPPQVRVVASMVDGPLRDSLARRAPGGPAFHLAGLPTEDGAAILDRWLREAKRRLSPAQRGGVLDAFRARRLPLWLRIAFEQARRWRSFEDTRALPAEVSDLIRSLFADLSDERSHGRLMVERSLALIAAGRHGLTEDELLDVLSDDIEVMAHVEQSARHTLPERRLPVAIWSRLQADLAPYLALRSADGARVYGFYHGQVRDVVEADYLAGGAGLSRHEALARHFAGRPFLSSADGCEIFHRRVLAELPFQQRSARMWGALEDTLLARYEFLAAKTAAGLVSDLLSDCASAASALPLERARLPALRLLDRTLRLASHVLVRDSRQLPSQLHGRLVGFDAPAIHALLESARLRTEQLWIRPLHTALTPPGGPLVLMLEGHTEWVTSVALTADGRRAVSASEDRTLRVWDLESGLTLHTLEGHTDGVTSVALTADGRRAVSASKDGTLRVWDLDSGLTLQTLEGHTNWVNSVALTTDGRNAVSASYDRTLRVWDLQTGQTLRRLDGHTDCVRLVALTTDGRRAVSAAQDHTLRVWDLESGRTLHTLEGHTWVGSMALTADGQRAVSASGDHTLRVWNLESGRALRTLEGHTRGVRSVALTADGRRAVSTSADKTLRVWDLERGEALGTFNGHLDEVRPVALTADGRRAVSGSRDETLRVWDLESGRALRTLEGHTTEVMTVALTTDGRRAVSSAAPADCTLRVWDLGAEQMPRLLGGAVGSVRGVAFAAQGTRAVSVSADTTVQVWDPEGRQLLRTLEGHGSYVRAVALTADGRYAVSSSMDKTLWVWDLDSGRALRTLAAHLGDVYCVALTADGRRAVSGSVDKTLRVWDLAKGRSVRTLEGHTECVRSVALTPDGRRAVSASWDNTLRVWDVESGQTLRMLEGHSDWVNSVALTADGQRAVSASKDHTLRVWDLESGRALRTLEGHTRSVDSVALTADGRRAVSTAEDKTLRVWDTRAGEVLTMFAADRWIEGVAIAPSGTVASAVDGRLVFLRLENA